MEYSLKLFSNGRLTIKVHVYQWYTIFDEKSCSCTSHLTKDVQKLHISLCDSSYCHSMKLPEVIRELVHVNGSIGLLVRCYQQVLLAVVVHVNKFNVKHSSDTLFYSAGMELLTNQECQGAFRIITTIYESPPTKEPNGCMLKKTLLYQPSTKLHLRNL